MERHGLLYRQRRVEGEQRRKCVMRITGIILVSLVLGAGLLVTTARPVERKLTASDAAGGDGFGGSVSISGDYAIVGAPQDDGAGSAYIFYRWGELQKLTASDAAGGDWFGHSVSISGDHAIVGAPGNDSTGSAYIFHRNQGGANNWGEVQKLTASDAATWDSFGHSVSISGDYAIVGAPGDFALPDPGSAYIFYRNQGVADNWGEVQKLTASDAREEDHFGYSVSISGEHAIVGAPWNDDYAGSAHIFYRNQGGANNWGQLQKLSATNPAALDDFGWSVSISGDYAIVGVPWNDDAGSAYIFYRNQGGANNWGQVQKLTASDAAAGDLFGKAVSISGDYAIVGAPEGDDDAGSAYIFYRWGEVQKLTASDAAEEDYFGHSVSISEDYAIVGAYGNDDAGSAYIYTTGPSSRALSLNEFGCDGFLKVEQFQIPADAVTVEFWMNSRDSDNAGTPISYAVSGTDNNEFLIYNYSNLHLYVKGQYVVTGISVNDGSWHHVAATWGSSNGGIKLYVDGIPEYTGSLKQGETLTQGGCLIFGQDQDIVCGSFQQNQAFIGLIDDVRIWSVVRTLGEIQAFMNEPLGDPRSMPELAGYWSFDYGTPGDLSPSGSYAELEGDARIVPLICGWPPVGYPVEAMALYTGWNMVAFMGSTTVSLQQATSSISAYLVSVWKYDASTQLWLRYIADASVPAFLNNLTDMLRGHAYWVQVSGDCIWNIGGGVTPSPSAYALGTPPFMLYGKVNSRSSGQEPEHVSLSVGGAEADSYTIGSNPQYMDYYVLEVPLDGSFSTGQQARMCVDDIENGSLTLGDIGCVRRHDIAFMSMPLHTKAFQNYPNPFNPETWIPYQLKEDARVEVRIYALAGQLVRTLSLGYKPAGYYVSKQRAAYWDGRNEAREQVASGMYFYTIQAGEFAATGKMIVAR